MKASRNRVFKYWDAIIDNMNKHAESAIEHMVLRVADTYQSTKAPTYMITKSAEELIDKINVDKIGLEIYSQIPNGLYAFVHMSDDSGFILIEKDDEVATVVVIVVNSDGGKNLIRYSSIRVDLEKNLLRVGTDDQDVKTTQKNEEFVNEDLKKVVAYIFLSEIELKILPINGKHGTATHPDRLKNDSSKPLTIVSDKWNTVTLRVGDFGVTGHFAWRAAGVGRVERRLIWIDSYVKHGYKKRG